MNRREAEAQSSVALDGGTRRACNNEYCLKDYGHAGECMPLTIEQAREILNKAKWRGRSDWKPNPFQNPGCLLSVVSAPVMTDSHSKKPEWSIVNEDAIAIATGIHGQKSRDIETAAYSGHATCPDCGGTGRQFASTVIAQAEARGFARGVEASVKVVDERLVFWGMRYLVELLVERLRALIPKEPLTVSAAGQRAIAWFYSDASEPFNITQARAYIRENFGLEGEADLQRLYMKPLGEEEPNES